jgi:hypothetical protein
LSIVSAVPAAGDLDDLGHGFVALLLLEGGLAIAHGMVLSFSPEMISSGPRCGFSLRPPPTFRPSITGRPEGGRVAG